MRYRKKPVEIDAILNEGEWPPIMAWLDELAGGHFSLQIGQQVPFIRDKDDGSLRIFTLGGEVRAEVVDWVICGVEGEFYPCKPDIFAVTYEPVDS